MFLTMNKEITRIVIKQEPDEHDVARDDRGFRNDGIKLEPLPDDFIDSGSVFTEMDYENFVHDLVERKQESCPDDINFKQVTQASFNMKEETVEMKFEEEYGDPIFKQDSDLKLCDLIKEEIVEECDKQCYKCDICGFVCELDCTYQIHMESCHESVGSKKYLDSHKKSQSDTEFKCEVCHKIFKYKAFLVNHIKRNRCVAKNECDICHRVLVNRKGLLSHLRTKHRETKYECDVCHKVVTTKDNLSSHKKIMHGVSRHECRLCHKVFKCIPYLLRHTRTIHRNHKYECDICHKIFTNKGSISTHKKVKHFETNIYDCEICNRVFKSKIYLVKHKKYVHCREKCECEICLKMFINIGELVKHIKAMHSDIKT